MQREDGGLAGPAQEDDNLRFGRYRVERLIGSGPIGAVFLGRDPILGRPVAIKRIPLRTGGGLGPMGNRLEELEAAFGALGALSHPHIVTVHDVGIQDGQAYLVSEFVPGTTLEGLVAEAPVEPSRVTALASQIATALDFAHGQGVSHGSLKPSNVLVATNGPAKVSDFGVAAALAHSRLGHKEWLTAAPWHLAPELVTEGQAQPASDQWSLAVLVFQMLTGRLPFPGESVDEALEAITERPPAPATTVRPSLPTEVDLVLLRSLDRDPTKRYDTCGELARRVATALGSSSTPALRQFATQPLDEELRRALEATQPMTDPLTAELPVPHPGLAPTPEPARRSRSRLGLWAAVVLFLATVTAFATRNVWHRALTPGSPAAPPAAAWDAEASPQRPAPTRPPPAVPPGVPAPRQASLRIQVASEVPDGHVAVWVADERVFRHRFQFGGPARYLRRARPGGRLESVARVPAGLQELRVRTRLPGLEPDETVLDGDLLSQSEAVLEIRISGEGHVDARLY